MTDVRREIDRVDRAIVALVAERQNYIEQAGRIKTGRDTVRDPARIEDVIAKVRAAAAREGAHPDLLETVYRAMVEWCIKYEFTVFDAWACREETPERQEQEG
ncbi:MAG: chorismate mutase [Alphaproteobacteria bacterium]|nr:MAG: chorismate mutase [Alphaproteobacteria bacterium]